MGIRVADRNEKLILKYVTTPQTRLRGPNFPGMEEINEGGGVVSINESSASSCQRLKLRINCMNVTLHCVRSSVPIETDERVTDHPVTSATPTRKTFLEVVRRGRVSAAESNGCRSFPFSVTSRLSASYPSITAAVNRWAPCPITRPSSVSLIGRLCSSAPGKQPKK